MPVTNNREAIPTQARDRNARVRDAELVDLIAALERAADALTEWRFYDLVLDNEQTGEEAALTKLIERAEAALNQAIDYLAALREERLSS